MTAITVHAELADAPLVAAAKRPIAPLRWSTIVRVEVRKAVDTRSGFWLVVGMVALSAVMLGWKVTHPEDVPQTYENYLMGVAMICGFVTPILGLLAMSSEWSQRTALTTFTLAPRRMRVLSAKAVAAVLLAFVVYASAAVLAAIALAVASFGSQPVFWEGVAGDLATMGLFVLLQVIMGLAFGALIGNAPASLVAFLAAPTIWANAGPTMLGDAAPWFDVFRAYDRLTGHDPFADGAQTLTAITVWVLIPAVIGTIRSVRREP